MSDRQIDQHSEKEVQVLRFKCCNGIYAMSVFPNNHKHWLKQVKEAIIDGDKVEVIKNKDAKLTYHINCKTKNMS